MGATCRFRRGVRSSWLMGATCRVRAHGALRHQFYGKISLDTARDHRGQGRSYRG